MIYIKCSGTGTIPKLLLVVAAAGGWSPALGGQNTMPRDQLTLTTAVDRALEHHPSTLAARAGVSAAKAAAGEVSAQRLPQLAIEASATRYQEPMIVAPLHALDINRAPDFDRTLLRGTASVSVTLFDGGVRRARVRGARAETNAAEFMSESATATLIAMVTRVYLRALTLRDVLDAHDNRLAALEAERDRAQKLFGEGTAARLVVLRAEAAIAQARAERVATVAALEVAEQNLARLTGMGPNQTSAEGLVPLQLRRRALELERETLVERAQATNPGLQEARSKHEAALSARRAASAVWLPNISLFGGYLGFGSAAGDFTAEWQGGAKISYPIFTGGARSSTNARTAALVAVARQEVRNVELSVREGVDRSLSAVRESRAQVSAVEQAVNHLEEVARIERLAVDAGSGTQTEYLRSQAELLRARASLIEARNNEIAARVELARTVGRLSPEWLENELENSP